MNPLLITPLLAAAIAQDETGAPVVEIDAPDVDDDDLVIVRAGDLPENFLDARAGRVVITPITSDVLPTAGYEKSPANGAFVQSPDGDFRLQFGGFTQIRWNANFRDAPPGNDPDFGGNDTTTGWSINRTRLFFEGRYTKDFSFHFQTNTGSSADTELLAAWGQYEINDRWCVRFGKQFIPLSREDWMYPHDLLAVEFSPNDFTFAIGSSLGIFAHYSGDRDRGWISIHNGAYGGSDEFPAPDETDVAGTVRWEWNLKDSDWSAWDDMVGRRGGPSGALLGLSAAYQVDHQQSEDLDGAQVNADLSFDGDGYHAVVAASATWLDSEAIAPSGFWTYGLMAQAGTFVSDHGQIYAQYNLVDPGDRPGDLEAFHSIAAGYSYFPFLWTNRWKFSGEVGYVAGAVNDTIVRPSGALGVFPSDSDGQGYVQLQAQIGF